MAQALDKTCVVQANLAEAYGEDRYRVSPLLRRKLAAGGGRFHAA
jgi:3-hydroxybutyryl-CoA dehydrogenase